VGIVFDKSAVEIAESEELLYVFVKATVGLDIHAVMLTKRSSPDGNEKGDVPLGNPTLPEDSTGIAESPAQTSVSKRTLALLYPLNI
jgi:hypothetical protein